MGSDWESIYFIKFCSELDLKFEGSQKDREKQFEDYIIPLIMPFVKEYGLNDKGDPSDEDIKECVQWLEGNFTKCDTLAKWCEKRGYKALCYWDLDQETGDNHVQCPVWLK